MMVLLILLALPSLVLGVPPQTNANGLEIAFPSFESGKVNTALEFPFHVYRINDGLVMTSSVNCTLHVYDAMGDHLLIAFDSTPSHVYDYEFNINNTVFNSVGWYSFNVYCECSSCSLTNTDLGGHIKHVFEITSSGYSKELNPFILLIGVIFILFFLVIAFKINEEHIILKLLSLGLAVVSFVATANLALEVVIQNQASTGVIVTLTSFYKIALLTEYLILAYVVLYYFHTFLIWFIERVNPK